MTDGNGKILFVRGYDRETTSRLDLDRLFAPFGEIIRITMPSDGADRFRGFAFVEFTTAEAAEAAMRELDGKEMDGGRRLTVNWAVTRRQIA